MEASTSFEQKTSADIASTSDATTTPTESAILTCIGVSGIVGNGIVLCVLLRDKATRKRLRNILVINQSLVDFLSCFLFIVIYISKSIPKSYEGAGIWWCWLVDVEVPLWLCIAVSTTNLMAITVERYLMVVFPVVYHNHITANFIYGTIAFVWVFTSGLICAFSYPFSGVYEGVCYLQAFFPHRALAWFVSVYYNIAYFIVPIFMFMVCYPHMVRVIKRRMKVQPGGSSNQNAKVSKRQMNLTQVMLSVSIAFVVCWAPLNIHYLLNFTGILPHLNMYDMLYRILVYLSLVNSCVNPFLYAYNYDDFKKGFRKILPLPTSRSDQTT